MVVVGVRGGSSLCLRARVCRVYLQVEDDVSCITGGTVKREGNHRRYPAPRCGKHGSAIFKHPAPRCIGRHCAASTSSPKYLIARRSREKIRDPRPVWLPRRCHRRHRRNRRKAGIQVDGNFAGFRFRPWPNRTDERARVMPEERHRQLGTIVSYHRTIT